MSDVPVFGCFRVGCSSLREPLLPVLGEVELRIENDSLLDRR